MNIFTWAACFIWTLNAIFAFAAGNFLAGINASGCILSIFFLARCERRYQLLEARLSRSSVSSVTSC